MTRAVVFAYHDVGVACLGALRDAGVEIARVYTHADDPAERRWFASVADWCADHGIAVSIPDDTSTAAFAADVAARSPDLLFSFYWRRMLPPAVLSAARLGAFNMHGSLLPRYRGRAPVNWAVLKGETETGATLHAMTAKPDAGDIVGQEAIPIGPDESAAEVMAKVTVASARVLAAALPGLIDGTAPRRPQDLAAGSYFGVRRPEDGVIDWHASARDIHNLVRAVAPPYPGASTVINGERYLITRTRLAPPAFRHHNPGHWNVGSSTVIALCGDGAMLRILEGEVDGQPHNEIMLAARLGIGLHTPAAPRRETPHA